MQPVSKEAKATSTTASAVIVLGKPFFIIVVDFYLFRLFAT